MRSIPISTRPFFIEGSGLLNSCFAETYFYSRGEWNFGGDPQSDQWSPQVNLTWLNFWTTDIRFWSFGPIDSANLTRGGPLMRLEAARQGQVEVSSPAAQQTHLKAGVYYMRRREGGRVRYLYGEAGVRPRPRWQMSISPTVVRGS